MAGGQERILKRRIKSVQSTKKITRAMELIAGSRIVKAQARLQAARPYSEEITKVVADLASGGAGSDSPLLVPREQVRRVGYAVMTADRGLAGAYNSSVIRAAERALQDDIDNGRGYGLVLEGRKAISYFRYRGYTIDAEFTGMSDQPTYENARDIAGDLLQRFESGDLDRVNVVYTKFLSAGSQEVTNVQLMPVEVPERPEHDGPSASYSFEPSPEAILEQLLPRYVEAKLYACMLDAAASEHAARQRAMKAATDNAEELIKSLSRVMNRARQDAITTEIMEIVGGAEALRSGAEKHQEPDVLLADALAARQSDPSYQHAPEGPGAFR
jgi:F-type H+-transporting ATPase subunit gamma